MVILRRAHGTIALGTLDAFVAADVPHAEESIAASAFGPARRRTWLGGRAALRAALGAHGSTWSGPILSTPRGAPRVASTVRASLSHKADAVAALVAEAARDEHVGLDLEEIVPLRVDIARRVLTVDELTRLPADAESRDALVRVVFSIKEAIYKALDPFVGRYIGFHEVMVLSSAQLGHEGEHHVTLATGERFVVESAWETLAALPGYTLATARARRG